MNRGLSDFLAVAIVAAACAAYAILFGFINTDSWYYVQLAQSLRLGEGCSVGGHYFAVFPCGYPAVLALATPSTDFAAIMIASKLANFCLLLASFACLRAFIGVNWVAGFIVIAPATLLISTYTWSENLLLFSTSLVLLLLKRLDRSAGVGGVVLLAIALLIGVSSRYFFAPYAFALWLGALVLYGRRTALWSFPAFLVGALGYVAYSLLNQHLTGYATGIERRPSLETLTFLISHFLWKIGTLELALTLAVLATLLALAGRALRWQSPREALRGASREMLFIVWAGGAFLLLALVLRIRAQYDLFSTRTIGPGLVFLVAGLAGLLMRPVPGKKIPAIATVVAGLLSLGLAHWQTLPEAIRTVIRGNYHGVPWLLKDYAGRFKDKNYDAIVTFSIPGPSPYIMFNADLYYGTKARIITPDTNPAATPDTVITLAAKLANYSEGQCAVDFTPYATRPQLEYQLDATYDLDYTLSLDKGKPVRKKMRVFDPGLAQYVFDRFVPGAVIDCRAMFPK